MGAEHRAAPGKDERIVIRNVLFDYGRVLARPCTGNWFLTPNTLRMGGFGLTLRFYLQSGKTKKLFREGEKFLLENHTLFTEEEEIEQFTGYYLRLLDGLGQRRNRERIARDMAYDCVKNDGKVIFYTDVTDGLTALKKNYYIGVVSDTWPSLRRLLDRAGVAPLLDGLVMSCEHGVTKNEGIKLFDIAAETLVIDPAETLFVDDSPSILDNAVAAGYRPLLMDRNRTAEAGRYPIARSMDDVRDYLLTLQG